jgi:hypothetical protein
MLGGGGGKILQDTRLEPIRIASTSGVSGYCYGTPKANNPLKSERGRLAHVYFLPAISPRPHFSSGAGNHAGRYVTYAATAGADSAGSVPGPRTFRQNRHSKPATVLLPAYGIPRDAVPVLLDSGAPEYVLLVIGALCTERWHVPPAH